MVAKTMRDSFSVLRLCRRRLENAYVINTCGPTTSQLQEHELLTWISWLTSDNLYRAVE